ncbi:MAG: hypothetical protein ACI8RD_002903, partial [Bacillariaceae sp.]
KFKITPQNLTLGITLEVPGSNIITWLYLVPAS